MRHFRSHADALTQSRMWANRLANVHSIRTHLHGQGDFSNHVAYMRANHVAAEDLAVAVGLRAAVKQDCRASA